MNGYQALHQSSAWLDLSSRGRLRATGEDRVRLLHAMCTNHIQQLAAGQGCYVFFLNPQGHILADAAVFALPDALLIDTEPVTRHSLAAHLERYIIADDVTLEDITAQTVEIGVEGPAAAQVAATLDAPVPAAPYGIQAWGDRLLTRFSTTGQPGFSVIAPVDDRDAVIRALEAAGAVAASPQDAHTVRLELGLPRYGEDIGERNLPHETQMLGAVHFNKGCYIGQEIVERVRSRGGVHRRLIPLEIEAETPPQPGAAILGDGKSIGEITSAAWSPVRRRIVALGYLRIDDIPWNSLLDCEGRPARIRAPKPLGAESQAV